MFWQESGLWLSNTCFVHLAELSLVKILYRVRMLCDSIGLPGPLLLFTIPKSVRQEERQSIMAY